VRILTVDKRPRDTKGAQNRDSPRLCRLNHAVPVHALMFQCSGLKRRSSDSERPGVPGALSELLPGILLPARAS